ncbi:DNA sulfur modification protein DndB [Oribacterium sp. NK2B42]|uniref:DNA sulfur modification protein DndB n=1 Tax=Oribacterium sp. NK2B42 TaxID=689781 RepID=UPI00040A40C9|nr:DNA sulfur modification protein DndB [Oribacterium sp. NK2B42]
MKTICVQKGKLGTTEYYLGKMPVGELVDTVGLAVELPEWKDMTADEKMQREPDINRVVNEICPYFTEDKDRFFGCVIVDIYSGFEDMIFEPITDVIPQLSAAYRIPLKDVGFLTLPGQERLIALDGQHRIIAMKLCLKGSSAISAAMLGGKKMTTQMLALEPHPELAKEEISVIFVEHTDNMKIRKIFNKVNKYARQTGRGQNIITADDDIWASLARRLFSEGEVLAKIGDIELVNWRSNTLSKRSKQLTTVSALYTIAETLEKDRGWSAKVLPTDEESIEEAFENNTYFWEQLLKGLSIYREYLALTREDKTVSKLREQSLLMKPVTHMALAHVAYMAQKKDLDWADIVMKLDKVDWSMDNPLWFNILVIGSANKKMITGKESIKAAGLVISYMVMGDYMTTEEIEEVRRVISNSTNGEKDELPQKIQ